MPIFAVEVVGSTQDNCEGCTRFVKDDEVFHVSNMKVTCLFTPGHTMGHISYFVEHDDKRVVFTGDCLFMGGVGRFFEGTAADMYPSLYGKLASLPLDTLVYCGHEYTLSNYKFALSVEGSNQDLIASYEKCMKLREEGKPTIPSTIDLELKTNPFLRVREKEIIQSLGLSVESDVLDILAAVREAKNNFK
jgi:hydroxyacylglutathione hydrolase